MKSYTLIENNEKVDYYARYDLLCDSDIILKTGLYKDAMQLLYHLMEPGDTYQELHKPSYEFPILDYDTVMRLRQNNEQ